MITVNLLPVKEAKRRQQLVLALYAGMVALVVLVGLGWFWWMQYQKVDALKAEIARVDEESKGYESKIKEVKDLEAKQASLETYRNAIKTIYDSQRRVLGALDQMALALPPDTWLISIVQGKDKDSGTFTVKGYSLAESSVHQYVEALKMPGGFLADTTVDEIMVKQSRDNLKDVCSFTLKAQLVDKL